MIVILSLSVEFCSLCVYVISGTLPSVSFSQTLFLRNTTSKRLTAPFKQTGLWKKLQTHTPSPRYVTSATMSQLFWFETALSLSRFCCVAASKVLSTGPGFIWESFVTVNSTISGFKPSDRTADEAQLNFTNTQNLNVRKPHGLHGEICAPKTICDASR